MGIDRARPGMRRIFSVVNEPGGVRSWQGEMPAASFAQSLPIGHMLGSTRVKGLAALRPFGPGQEWDPASKPMALLYAEAFARTVMGQSLTQVGWDAQRVVQSGELTLARQEAEWQGGFTAPVEWTRPVQEWLIRGLTWAQEPALARYFESRLAETAGPQVPVAAVAVTPLPVAGATPRASDEMEAESASASV